METKPAGGQKNRHCIIMGPSLDIHTSMQIAHINNILLST